MSDTEIRSYTSADVFPTKLLHVKEALEFKPVHVQWLPTNRCNLKCPSCSCADRDQTLEMPIDTAVMVIGELRRLGCMAVTITGGGEPLMHPQIDRMIRAFSAQGIKVGLVTNGTLLHRLSDDALGCLTWCRISSMDHREFSQRYYEQLDDAVRRGPNVDWAFSHVVTGTPNLETIEKVVDFANTHEFTHVRLVCDIMDPHEEAMEAVKESLVGQDSRVIYQSRANPVPASSCLIGYVKPLIAADFKMYLCCGVQYALGGGDKDLPEELCMGSALHLSKVYDRVQPFAVKCSRCYYTQYNEVLTAALASPKHREFI